LHHPTPAVPSDSLIPMFEGMVDRALSRTNSAAQAPDNRDGVEARAQAASGK